MCYWLVPQPQAEPCRHRCDLPTAGQLRPSTREQIQSLNTSCTCKRSLCFIFYTKANSSGKMHRLNSVIQTQHRGVQLDDRFPPHTYEKFFPSLNTSSPDAPWNQASSPAVLQSLPLCLLFVLSSAKTLAIPPLPVPWKAITLAELFISFKKQYKFLVSLPL